MLPQPNRLPSSVIPLVMRRGKRTAGDTIALTALKREAPVSRFSFIVSTKIDKRATKRNRMRRLLRESVRHLFGRISPGYDCIVTARRDMSGMEQEDAEKMVIDLLKKAKVLGG